MVFSLTTVDISTLKVIAPSNHPCGNPRHKEIYDELVSKGFYGVKKITDITPELFVRFLIDQKAAKGIDRSPAVKDILSLLKRLGESITQTSGILEPLIVDEDNSVIEGNSRFLAVKLGYTKVKEVSVRKANQKLSDNEIDEILFSQGVLKKKDWPSYIKAERAWHEMKRRNWSLRQLARAWRWTDSMTASYLGGYRLFTLAEADAKDFTTYMKFFSNTALMGKCFSDFNPDIDAITEMDQPLKQPTEVWTEIVGMIKDGKINNCRDILENICCSDAEKDIMLDPEVWAIAKATGTTDAKDELTRRKGNIDLNAVAPKRVFEKCVEIISAQAEKYQVEIKTLKKVLAEI